MTACSSSVVPSVVCGQCRAGRALYPVKDAWMYIERHPLGGPRKGFQGDSFFAAANPTYGAVFTAYLKEKMRTRKEKRQEAEKQAAKKNQTLPYPSNDELRAEAEEAKPEIYFLVYDESGVPIRRVEGSTEAGFQRVAWALRYPAAKVAKLEEDTALFRASDQGPLAMAGTYSVRLFQKVAGVVTELGGPQSFKVTTEQSLSMTTADRAHWGPAEKDSVPGKVAPCPAEMSAGLC